MQSHQETGAPHTELERPADTLLRVWQEYATLPHTPEFIQRTWQTMLGAWVALAREADPTFDIAVPMVPDCGRTQQQLEALRRNNKARIFIPDFDYPTLARLFPRMGSDNVASGRARDDIPVKDWYNVRMDIIPPNLGITEGKLREQAVDGLEVGSAKTLIWIGQASHVLDNEGRYPGQNGHWFLVPNTRVDGRVARAGFSSGGLYVLADWFPDIPDRSRGGLLQRK